MAYPNLERSNLLPDHMFFQFDCGDLWIRKNVNFQDDLDICFEKVVLPSILDLANNEIANFTWAMRYTVPFLKQIKGLKNNQNYKIIEETEITNKGEIENDNHNENFIDPINFDGKTLTMIDDIFLFPPELIIGLIIKFKEVENISLLMSKMRGGFLEMSDDEDDYINKTLKNPNWWTCNMNIDDKNFIEDLKIIKKGINSSIKFDFTCFPDEEIKKLDELLKNK
jgi:hypothetical protein